MFKSSLQKSKSLRDHFNQGDIRHNLQTLIPHMQRRVPELQQVNSTECGAACLAMVLSYHGRKTTVAEMRDHCGVGRNGLSALTIVKAAREYGLRVRSISLQQNNFRSINLPAIIYWEFNHYLIVERWSPKYVHVVDPASGRRKLSADEFDKGFTGVVIMLEPGVQFSRRSRAPQASLWIYLKHLIQSPGSVIQLIAAALILQLLGLSIPLFTKIFVDLIVPEGMLSLMPIIGLGILILLLTQFVTTLLRATLLVYLQAKLDMQMMIGFFEHLLALPYRFFQQRSNGDLISRLNSNLSIREMFTNQLVSTILDGGTIIIYFLILMKLSLTVSILILIVGLFQVILLLVTTRLLRDLTKRDLIAQGKVQGYMTESLMGIASLKAAGAEQRAIHRWSDLFFNHLNISIRRDYFSSVISTILSSLTTFTPLVLLWFGTQQVLSGSMTVGTMLALNSLAWAFLTPLSSLASSGQKLQLIRAHFERIADVLEAEPEQNVRPTQQTPVLKGQVELKNISFRYDLHAPLVLRNIDIHIEPGKKVALVGRTGSGKSTLGKLLLGLYQPSEGEILYDGIPLQNMNYQSVRSQFGAVLQESFIFSGSVRENIAINDPGMNLERVIEIAKTAAIHDEIEQMPMGYETKVAEAGSALSGGQRQRLSLARALAHKPTILLLDEATSHLDVVTEQAIAQHLSSLSCTQIIIAHRLSTIRNADLILVLDEGVIVERGTHDQLLQSNGHYSSLVQSQSLEEKSHQIDDIEIYY